MRGQFFITDLIAATTIILIFLSVVIYYHDSLLARSTGAWAYKQIERQAEFVSDSIYNNLTTAGVFYAPDTDAFFSQSYQNISDTYNLGGFNFSVTIQDFSSPQNTLKSVGGTPQLTNSVVYASRIGVYGSSAVQFTVAVWLEK